VDSECRAGIDVDGIDAEADRRISTERSWLVLDGDCGEGTCLEYKRLPATVLPAGHKER
jgi:hypothetical protein